jgi:uncharacterized protein YhjY with autotransporter beta-barrel domain
MKPKFQNSPKSLPLIICVAMSATTASHAGIFSDDTAGNAQPTVADNGATTIRANGGTSAAPVVTIAAGVSMTGSVGETGVLDISAPNYSVTNAGSLVGSIQRGILSSNAFSLNNSGTIVGAGASREGISSPFATIINSGTIRGSDDAVFFLNDGGSITNTGSIEGIVGGSSDGISARSGLTVNNNGAGFILGKNFGIIASDGLILNNAASGDVVGETNNGVFAGNLAQINNSGRIQSITVGDGVKVGNDGTITNLTTFSALTPFAAIAGGRILGIGSGIRAGDNLTFTNQNLGLVQAAAGTAIVATNGANITNALGGTLNGIDGFAISVQDGAVVRNHGSMLGTNNGIAVRNNLDIINGLSGTINGGLGRGIDARDGAVILNNGSIIAVAEGIYVKNGAIITNTGSIVSSGNDGIENISNTTFILNNTGLIAGVHRSVYGDDGIDTLNLNFGSRLIGEVDLLGANDTINFNGGLASTAAADGASSNSILGDINSVETINKSGSGVAFIGVPNNGGHDVEVGTINVTQGGLYINADIFGLMTPVTDGFSGGTDGDFVGESSMALLITAPVRAVINAGGSEIGGTGIWDADLNLITGSLSAGAIPINLTTTPLDSIGVVEIAGAINAAPGTFLRVDIRPNSPIIEGINSDLVLQSGTGNTLNINGSGIRISATSNNRVIGDGRYTVIDSDAPILGMGTFSGLGIQFNPNINAQELADPNNTFVGTEVPDVGGSNQRAVLNRFMKVLLDDAGTDVVIEVKHNFAGLPGLTRNQSNLGKALDNSINTSDVLTQDLISAFDYSDLYSVQTAIRVLDPSPILDITAGIANGNYRLHRLAENHLAAARDGEVIMQSAPATTDAKGVIVQEALVPSTRSNNGNVWGTLSYDWKDSNKSSSNDLSGEDASFTAGVDYRVAPQVALGLLVDGSRTDYDTTGGNADVDSYRIAAYGTYGEATGLYANFLLGYGAHSIDQHRDKSVILGAAGQSSTDATSLQGMLTVGYTMQANAVKHGPFAGFEYQNVDVDGFTQNGKYPIAVRGFDAESARALIGYRVDATYGHVKPYLSVAYAHEFEDGASSTSARLPSGAGFRVSGGQQDSAFLIATGANFELMEHLDLNIGYRGEISTGDGLDSHGGSLGINYSF